MAYVGSTVQLTARFHNFDNTLSDATGITMTVYDPNRVVVGTPVTITSGSRISLGTYQTTYLIPQTTAASLTVEFKATVAGLPSLARTTIPIRWV